MMVAPPESPLDGLLRCPPSPNRHQELGRIQGLDRLQEQRVTQTDLRPSIPTNRMGPFGNPSWVGVSSQCR